MTSKPEIKVGIVVFLALILFAYAVIYVGKVSFVGGSKGYEIKVLYDFVSGLKVNAKVKIAGGVYVGEVKDIWYDGRYAKVTLFIYDYIKIRKDADFSIYTTGLMGEKYVEVSVGTEKADFLNPGDTVMGKSPISLDVAFGNIYKISDNFKQALDSFNSIISKPETKEAIANTFKNISEAVVNVDKMVLENKAEITEAVKTFRSTSEKINNAADDLKGLTTELKVFTSKLNEFVSTQNKDNVASTLENLNKISAKLDNTISSLNGAIAKVEKGEGTLGVLLNDKKMAEDLKALVDDIKQNPWKLMWKK
jgi:phospholipid/cholesterol/gamma-HCH transport system substrate-binding protein